MDTSDTTNKATIPAPRWDLQSIFPGGSGSKEYKVFRDKIRVDLDKAKKAFAKLPPKLSPAAEAAWVKFILEFQRLGEHLDLARSFVRCCISEKVSDELGHAIFRRGRYDDRRLAELCTTGWKRSLPSRATSNGTS